MARPPKITNEEILSAARQVFLEQGFGASTLVIAEKAGISEASIFKRFTTKQALFLAAIGITETPKWVKTMSSDMPTAAIKSELTDICNQMFAFYQEVLPRVMMMMAQGNMPFPPQSLPIPPPIRDSRLLAEFLERAIARGYLRSCDPMTVAVMIIGAITNYVMTQNMSNLPIPLPSPKRQPIDSSIFIPNLIETLWAGIAPNP
jgi:AcrR family transcriptional regulator